MAKVKRTIPEADFGLIAFFCPGCKCLHFLRDAPAPNPEYKGAANPWTFNGNMDAPTFSPSVLVKGTVPITDEEHQKIMNGEKIIPKDFVCHSFITDGKIQFLDDCSHELKGQIVELGDVDVKQNN